MGWLRLVGSLKSWVSFAKEPYKRDYILQKRPIIWRSLLSIANPYVYVYVSSYSSGWMSHVTHMNESCHTYEWVMSHSLYMYIYILCVLILSAAMGWLRLLGSLKVWVSFEKEPYKRDDILKKRPIIFRSLFIVATLYLFMCLSFCVSVFLCVCLFVCLSFYVSVFLCVCLFMCLSFCASVFLRVFSCLLFMS